MLAIKVSELEMALASIAALAHDTAPQDYATQLAVIAKLADEALGDDE
jgi:hypothetical protein